MILLDWQEIYRKKHAKGGLGSGAGILQKNAFAAYLVRPQAGETSRKKQLSCGRARERFSLLFPFHGGFRLCGGDQRAFRSPFGNLRGFLCCEWGVLHEIDCL